MCCFFVQPGPYGYPRPPQPPANGYPQSVQPPPASGYLYSNPYHVPPMQVFPEQFQVAG